MKIALLASRRMVTGFLLGGVHTGYVCENEEESRINLEACLKDGDIGIILVSKTVASMIPDRIQELKNSSAVIPVISVIPDVQEHMPPCSG
ncbi:MAG TPA: V-type ATP synthase subunit F [Methanospirillum sp.]|uniref:V-type ATP synthase subunit F n=1 Tax=Methanospirillum sp. TaxID=45200 RepID=UPI002B6064E2|nr:V-type ATP synthase subunit F [Methanospirillum sp.]HOJ97528.1 V-type ATP synthase subunit F [Methanospirillum sp.]HOL41449.1 V-type ATP synthase subunit F [Methanospirillum sp.]